MAANSQEALQQLEQFQASRANPLDIYNKATSDLGVQDVRGRVGSLRGTILNTENLLNQVEGSVTGRTQGSLVTEAQRQRLANLERQPLASQYGQQSKSLANEQATLSDLLNQAQQRSGMEFQGLQTKEQSMRDVYNSLFQREQEQRRREEADRAFAESQRQYNESLRRQSSGGGGGGRSGGGGAAAGGSKDSIPQAILKAVGAGASWGDIARDLDRSFGGGTATKYDLLLKQTIGAREGDPMKYMR